VRRNLLRSAFFLSFFFILFFLFILLPAHASCLVRRPGTYADVYWISEARYDQSDDYVAKINTGHGRIGSNRAPPRYNCTACPPVSKITLRASLCSLICINCSI
jgi:hypothetical protein